MLLRQAVNQQPQDHANKSQAMPEPVEDASESKHHHRVRQREGKHNPPVVAFRPVKNRLQVRSQEGDGSAVDVINGRAEKQQRANEPAQMRNGESGRGSERGGGRIHEFGLLPATSGNTLPPFRSTATFRGDPMGGSSAPSATRSSGFGAFNE